MSNEHLVIFTPSGKRGHFSEGTSVLDAARSLGVDLDSVCGGRGICGRCQVIHSVGSFSKHGIESNLENLTEKGDAEKAYEEQYMPLVDARRLGCHSYIQGDIVVDVPPESQVHKQVVRKKSESHDIKLSPSVKLYLVEVAEPDMHDPTGDWQRLKEALEFEWDLTNLSLDINLYSTLQDTLRKGKWQVTVAVYDSKDVISIWPGFFEDVYGMAVDVGSTTVAAHLCSLKNGDVVASSGLMNPQIRFGEDLMSRVSYVMMNPGGEKEMTSAIREALQTLAESVAKEAGIDITQILDVTLVGNPIMHHLFMGINPVELGGAPFALTTNESMSVKASDLDLSLHQNARVFVLPCIAGHVGADTAGVILSEEPYNADEITLLVDVGTNAEIVIGNKDRLLAASSPTGPAFEGAQISCGQRAAPGAIERVRIDKDTLEPRFKVIGSDLWSNEEGFDEAIKDIGVTGVCGSGIIEVVAEMYLAGIISIDGVIDGNLQSKSERIVENGRTYSYLLHSGPLMLYIQQNDVRAIQLAKAALYAGIKLLMDHLKVDKVDKIRLAGAFGSFIDVKYAMVLGLIPDCAIDNVSSAGNAAGTGARIALLNESSRTKISQVVRSIEKIETALEKKFQDHFVDAMAIPNKVDFFEELSKVVEFPKKKVIENDSEGSQSEDGGRKRRRRRRS